ncbi:Transcriptional repressor SdpR (modular protein) [Acidobacteriia bacterium SbA2]|nr:Transcriptional repressor SdpR (modular protein) [Acidobacteriia bacterium SbA2]
MAPSSNQAFKAIADPTRREILRLLRRGEMTAGDLAERFDMTKPTMSHHFAVLKEADLLTSRRDGQQIWYGLNTTVVQDLMAWAMDLMRSESRPKENRPKENRTDDKPGAKTPPEEDAK